MVDPTLSLPEEVAEQVFILLPVKDILSCCLVSSLWRNAVNKNLIWKKLCSPEINLEDVESVVKPSFQVLQCECESLTPICEYRLKYMQEIHLRNNFRNNRCVEYQFSFPVTVAGVEVLDKYIVLNDKRSRMIHVWDIEGTPYLIQSVPYLLNERYLRSFKTSGDCLLIVQFTLLQIYEMVEGGLSLKMCRVLDREEAFSHTIPEAGSVSEWYYSHYVSNSNRFTDDIIVGKYYTGITEDQNLNQSIVHIWDLETGKKLKTDAIPPNSFKVKNIFCGNNSDYMYITLFTYNNNETKFKLFSYNLEELQFTELSFESTDLPLIGYEKFVIVLSRRESVSTFMFIDSNTGKKIFEMTFDNPIDSSVFDVYNSLMVFGNYNKTVTVVDLSTQEAFLKLDLNVKVLQVQFLNFNVLLVTGIDGSFEVWDIKNNCRLYTLCKKEIFSTDRGLARLILLGRPPSDQYSCSIIKYW